LKADKKAIEDNDAGALAAMIIQSAYPHHSYLLSNHFFYSPVKRRLKMLSKYKNSKAGYFYRILALPVVLFLIAVLTIKAKSGISEMLNPSKKITVVIDAGHGGTDGGATASDNITMEKAITLSLVNKIKELNTYSIKLKSSTLTQILIWYLQGRQTFINIQKRKLPFLEQLRPTCLLAFMLQAARATTKQNGRV